jgi:hypothetical protein
MRDAIARLQLPRIALTLAKAALFALPGAGTKSRQAHHCPVRDR